VSLVDDPLQPATDGLTAQTLRGAKWSYLSTLVNAGLQVIVTAVLARLLAPSAFGLVAMAGLVLRFGQYFAQMGVGQALVQRRDLTGDHMAAGFWVSVVVGALFSGLAWIGAPLVAGAFNSPSVVGILRVMGLSFVVSGVSAASFAVLRRELRFKEIAVVETASFAMAYGVGIAMAFAGYGAWSLVVAGLGQAALASLAFLALARPRLALVVRWQPYRQLLGFGTKISAVSFLEFLNSSLDTMVVGRFAGATLLGYYSKALNLTGLPLYYMSTSLSRVLLPSFSRIQDDVPRIRKVYLEVMTLFAGIGLPVALGMSGAARELVAVLLGSQWGLSVPVTRLVALAAGAAMLSNLSGITLEATAHLGDKLVIRVGQLVLFATLLLVLAPLGLWGYGLAFAVSEVCVHAALAARTSFLFRIPVRDALGAYWSGLCTGLLIWAALGLESSVGVRLAAPSGVVLAMQLLTSGGLLASVGLRLQRGRLYWLFIERLGAASSSRAADAAMGFLARMAGQTSATRAAGAGGAK
jgi:O-antigen/teichoic acid export membrane protein